MKKNIILVLALVLALSLAGCGSKAVEEPKTEPEQEAVVEDIAPAPTETVSEIVEEEPEVEETSIVEEPEVEDPFAKYDNGDFLGEDIYTALDEFEGQPVAIIVATGRNAYNGFDFIAYNYNAVIDTAIEDSGTYVVLVNDGSYGDKPELSGLGLNEEWSLSKTPEDTYYVGSLTDIYFNEIGALRGDYVEQYPSIIMLKIEDGEAFSSTLIKDADGNNIGILFKSKVMIPVE